MSYLVTLKLPNSGHTLTTVRANAVLDALDIDESYGLVCISPKRNLYVLRVHGDMDESLVETIEQVVGVHGDTRVSGVPTGNPIIKEE